MPNESIFPARRATLPGYKDSGVTVIGGNDALVNVDSIKTGAKESLNTILEGVGRVVNKALPAAIAASATLQYRGSQGSFISFTDPIQLECRFFSIGADNSDKIGYPSHAVNTLLSGLSGFVLCENAVIEIDGSITEEQAIEDLLNSGIFIEA